MNSLNGWKTLITKNNPFLSSVVSLAAKRYGYILTGIMAEARVVLVAVAAIGGVWTSVPTLAEDMVSDVAMLQGLDKVTARVSTLRAPINRTVHFGTLEIVARTCRKRPPEEPPESAAFLQIRDIKPGEAPETLFQGWMFASSPALSALEHPVYDIWVIDCLSRIGPKMTLSP